MQIAIDGPAGAGKSTIAKILSKDINFMYVDTGAMYRTIGLYCLRNNIDLDDEKAVSELAVKAPIEIKYEDGIQKMYLGDEDVSKTIRLEEVGKTASKVSKVLKVRERLVELQKELGEKYDVVMDGRDIGTVVLPNAELKIFLTASSDVRAKRRCDELLEKGEAADFDVIKKDIEERDFQDSHRKNSPLKQADDAILLDTSDMSIDEVVSEIKKLLKERLS